MFDSIICRLAKLACVSTLLLTACQQLAPLYPHQLPVSDSRHLGDLQNEHIVETSAATELAPQYPTAAVDDYSRAPLLVDLQREIKPTLVLPNNTNDKMTVSVNQVEVGDLLFALGRDANLELDISADVIGKVSINATERPLDEILERIRAQLPLRYVIDGQVLRIEMDNERLQTYKIPYLNMARNASGGMSLAVQVGSTGSLLNDGASAKSNNSSVDIENKSRHDFWDELVDNITAIIDAKENQQLANQTKNSAKAETPPEDELNRRVIANRNAGLLTVRASDAVQLQVQKYLHALLQNAKRQVLIEATIAEVELGNHYEQGVDWSRLLQGNGVNLSQSFNGNQLQGDSNQFNIAYLHAKQSANLQATINLLQQFGNVKILSSPKIMALNNQASVLKVVDNRVYFSLDVLTTNEEGVISRTFGSEVKTVPEGFMMVLMPSIDDNGDVILNIRPTITRVVRFIDDPNPALAEAKVRNPVPEIQVREMETVLRLKSGQVAVLGGLMQDSANINTSQVPVIGSVPVAGNLFKGKSRHFKKSELLIFVRPVSVLSPEIEP